MSQTVSFLNTTVHNLTMSETVELIDDAIRQGDQLHHVVVNAGKLVQMEKDEQLRESVNSSDLINADGQAVVWASKVLGKPLKERVAGIDLMENLIHLAGTKGYTIYLFGAKEEVVSEVARIYEQRFPGIVAGYRNGYFEPEQQQEIARDIAESGANMLFVAISSPIKENFLHDHKELLAKVNLIMGVGGSFDVVSGKTRRAPLWMQRAGLEWFYRFLQEPGRMWKRYLVGNTRFIFMVLKERFGSR